ncbi:GGDEF domain-containing protein [Veronia pacifica]|uniref:diguanylate cyclase n=1 Tax=Veronia pacifica TaxID=1080227 RepID=A0A1C3EQ05_9GAMM|nr:GGDEF domain-containing protein [Veronia pacifica]ODA35330.1 hypothetical protein A8L45_03955 [Veronia pacifica]
MYLIKKSALLIAVVFTLLYSSCAAALPKQLIVTGSSTWEPFSFINSEGEPDGIMVDFWKLYGEKNHVEIKFQLMNWPASIALASTDTTVIHGGLGYTSNRAKYLYFSRELPLQKYDVYLFAKRELNDTALSHLSDLKVGSVTASVKDEFLTTRLPSESIRRYDTFGGLNEAAYRGDIDVFIDDLNTTLYGLYKNDRQGTFTPRKKLYSFSIHFAVSRQNARQMPAIEKGLENITDKEVDALYHKWFDDIPGLEESAVQGSKLKWPLISVSILFIAVVSIIPMVLRRKSQDLKNALKALATSSAKLEQVTQLDRLTGTLNRDAFYNVLNEKRFSPSPYSIAVLDLDNLGQLNAECGHQVGDIAIKHLISQLRGQLSSKAVIARLGGGEFAILFDYCDRNLAIKRIDKLRRSLPSIPLSLNQQVLPLSFCYSFAHYPEDGDEGSALVNTALKRMRQHKAERVNNLSAGIDGHRHLDTELPW